MNEVVREWIGKAEGDFSTATREMAVADTPNYDAVCFHAQQCIEKYIKALLIVRGIVPPRVHDLAELNRLLVPVCPEWQWPVEELRLLSRSAVAFRYPGESASEREAEAALGVCRRARRQLRGVLGFGT